MQIFDIAVMHKGTQHNHIMLVYVSQSIMESSQWW